MIARLHLNVAIRRLQLPLAESSAVPMPRPARRIDVEMVHKALRQVDRDEADVLCPFVVGDQQRFPGCFVPEYRR